MSKVLTWGILGTGGIAGTFAKGIAASQTSTLLAVGSRTQQAADVFGDNWNVPRRYGSYEALLADDDVQAIYISTPHPFHAEWAIKAADAGKHVLCEKPIGLNAAEAMAIIEAAQRNDVFLMEAFMYRCHPQIAKLVELIRSGAIGQVRVIQATFTFHANFNPESRLFNNALGGGGILDVGCYCVSMARLIAGAATGKDFAEPTQVKATGYIGDVSHVDEYAIVSLYFPGDVLAQLFTGTQVNGENVVRISGSEGSILLSDPWLPPNSATKIIVKRDDEHEPRTIVVENDRQLYSLEADTVATYLEERQAPVMRWEDTLGNMRVLDQWRADLGIVHDPWHRDPGVVYDVERPDGPGQHLTVNKRALAVHADTIMKYGRVPGFEKPLSRLIMGVDNQYTWPHAAVMFDDFFERGGTCFDSAHIYGGGVCERLLGHWVKNRAVREQVVILDKGAIIPYCNPTDLTRQFFESLDRLQMDYVDIYMMHRDNPDIPVGEFISVLNEHKNAGRMRAFGASNWSIERFQEANAWAKAHGMIGFCALSNNFSLARMLDPVWEKCVSASDVQSRAWLTETQTTLMPWSSQARGFFTGRPSDEEMVRCWYSDDNFQRLERVNQMAQERNVLPISIVLAYVLCQPFPTFPLIGPRQLSETRTSFSALMLELTPEDLLWLNLEA